MTTKGDASNFGADRKSELQNLELSFKYLPFFQLFVGNITDLVRVGIFTWCVSWKMISVPVWEEEARYR